MRSGPHSLCRRSEPSWTRQPGIALQAHDYFVDPDVLTLIRRRHVGVFAAAALSSLHVNLGAQQTRSARIGVLYDRGRDGIHDAMFKRLATLGWVEGQNLNIEFYTLTFRAPDDAARVQEMARLKCDLIFANGTPAAMLVKAHAPRMPMVFVIGGDPVGLGLVTTLAKPGGNATGYTQLSQQFILKQLSLLVELVPKAKRIAVMFEADNPSMIQGVWALTTATKERGLALKQLPLRDYNDVDAAHTLLLTDPNDGLLVMYDRVTSSLAFNIVNMAQRLRLPAVYSSRYFSESGAALSYGIDWPALVLQSADYVARILHGVKPADLPVQQAGLFELIVNVAAARAQGLDIPQSILLQATEVIR